MVLAMTGWDDIVAAVGVALGGDPPQGRHDLRACWDGTAPTDQAQRCVLAHYLADLEDNLAAEVAWDERALAAFAHVQDADLTPVGIPAAASLAPSLHLNLGDGYLRQGRTAPARDQLAAGLAALRALPDDGYGAMIRRGLTGLQERLANQPQSQSVTPARAPDVDPGDFDARRCTPAGQESRP